MPSTFLELTNKLLVAFNEVPLTEGEFASARNVQAVAKQAVNNAIARINNQTFEWPFNAFEKTDVLVKGQEEYSWAVGFKTPDWASFVLVRDDTYNIRTIPLRYISRDVYYRDHRAYDDDRGVDGGGIPRTVFPSHGSGYGITPSPDQTYSIKYRYWRNPPILNLYNDTTTIPVEHDHVIISAASFDMHMFRDNKDAAQIVDQKFNSLIGEMRRVLIGNYDTVNDTRVQY